MQNCDNCGSDKSKLLYSINRFKKPFKIHSCRKCGLIFMKPFFSNKEIESFYKKEYFTGNIDDTKAFTYTDERKNKKGFTAVNKKRVKKILEALDSPSGKGKNFLDIGCSFGALLDEGKKLGFSVTGMDISDYALAELKRNSINIIKGSPETNDLPVNKFDVITLIEVIEHLKKPGSALKKIFHSLKKNGLLVIQTANMDGRQAKKAGKNYHYFLPGHLHYFSRKTLTEALKKAGFNNIRLYYPCEFGLLPKLIKSKGDFKKPSDYLKWIRIIFYHLKSKIHTGNFALTSAMVVYARKR